MRLKVILSAAVLLYVAGCIFPAPEISDVDTLPYFEFIQHGERVLPCEGTIILDRAPFEVRFGRPGWQPSLSAFRNLGVVEQYDDLPDILTAVPGTGMAVADNDLEVIDGHLECYTGWSAQFQQEWGIVYRSDRADYDRYRSGLTGDPVLLLSGRDYNFSSTDSGILVHYVKSIEGVPVSVAAEKRLVLLLFMERSDAFENQSFHPLYAGSIVLCFRN